MKDIKRDLVYVPMVADHIHHGHINIINIAKKYGYVVVGLMTDKAAASYKKLPLLNLIKIGYCVILKGLMKLYLKMNLIMFHI